MSMNVLDLPDDVLLEILGMLPPRSVVLLGTTCRRFYALSNLRDVWTTRLRENCAEQDVHPAIYNIESMSTPEVQDVVLRPFRCLAALQGTESLDFYHSSVLPFQILDPSLSPQSRLAAMLRGSQWTPYTDPTGRFLVVTVRGGKESTFFELWDFGTSPKTTPRCLGSVTRNAGRRVSSWVRGIFTRWAKGGILEIIIPVFNVAYAPEEDGTSGASSLELYRFRLHDAHQENIERIGALRLTPSQGWGLARITIQDDLVLCYHRAPKPFIIVWDFIDNTIVVWDAPDNHQRSQIFFCGRNPIFIAAKHNQISQYQLPTKDAFVPISSEKGFFDRLHKISNEAEVVVDFLRELRPGPSYSTGDADVEPQGILCRTCHTDASIGFPMHYFGILITHDYDAAVPSVLVVYTVHSDEGPTNCYRFAFKILFTLPPEGFTFFEDDIFIWRYVLDGESIDYSIIRDFPNLRGDVDIHWMSLKKSSTPFEPEHQNGHVDQEEAREIRFFRIGDFVFRQQGTTRETLGWLSRLAD